MHVVARGTVIRSREGTDLQSCAFPQVGVLPGGRWIVGCRAARSKAGKEGQHVLQCVSDDEGGSWSPGEAPFAAPLVEERPGQLRAYAPTALGGNRVLATLYWVDNSDPGLPFFNEKTQGLLDSRILFAESRDRGESWSAPALRDTTPYRVPTPITGPVLRFPDGELVCQFETNKHYEDAEPWIHSSVLMFSRDGGRSWPRHCVVTRDPRIFSWDQRPQLLADGTILDLFWTYDNAAAAYLTIHARESRDRGRTWSELRDTGVAGQPAQPVPLPDGRTAMVFVDRSGAPAIRARVSHDGGRSWPQASELSLYQSALGSQSSRKDGMADAWSEMEKFSVGLPATAILANSDFLVVYYAGASPDSTSIHWVRVRAD